MPELRQFERESAKGPHLWFSVSWFFLQHQMLSFQDVLGSKPKMFFVEEFLQNTPQKHSFVFALATSFGQFQGKHSNGRRPVKCSLDFWRCYGTFTRGEVVLQVLLKDRQTDHLHICHLGISVFKNAPFCGCCKTRVPLILIVLTGYTCVGAL